jgi:AraC-like DNA-binding protein
MDVTLLVSKLVCRKVFQKEDYIGEDDIFALVVSGSFVFDNGSGMQTVGPLEGVNFQRGVRYHRQITQEAQIYLFRYRTQEDIFGNGKVVFRDTERIRSTLRLLQLCDSLAQQNDFICKQALFTDIVTQFRLEKAAQYQTLLNTDSVILSAISYIRDNLHRKMNLEELAQQHFLSYVQFSRRFKNATGSTPQDYVAGLRLKKAKQLLAETDLSIQKISENCGFSNAYYFSNFFRKHCQFSPSQYRALLNAACEGEK